ncbi:hypothetical protein ACCT25_37630, partial [Rhizobium ruizarguesonis]
LDPDCVGKTFPAYWRTLAGLNAISGLRKRLLAPHLPHLHPFLDPCVELAAAMSTRLTGIKL